MKYEQEQRHKRGHKMSVKRESNERKRNGNKRDKE